MTAYFSSKITKQIQAAFTAALLIFCLLGTHWVGFSHSISHAQFQSQSEVTSIPTDVAPSLNHSSDACHLFDAITLAGFIASGTIAVVAYSGFTQQSSVTDCSLIAQVTFEHYQTRAPPILLL